MSSIFSLLAFFKFAAMIFCIFLMPQFGLMSFIGSIIAIGQTCFIAGMCKRLKENPAPKEVKTLSYAAMVGLYTQAAWVFIAAIMLAVI